MESNLFRVLLNCGEYDINMLLDITYDWYDIFDYEAPLDIADFNSVLYSAINYGLEQLQENIDNRVDELEAVDEPTKEENTELEALKKLITQEDFDIYLNYIDSRITCMQHQDIYNKYLKEAIDAVETGLSMNIENL